MFPIEPQSSIADFAYQQRDSVQQALSLVQGGPLIGREQEILELIGLLQQPEIRLLTLTGTGGVGKTRLASQAAALLRPAFRDGVYIISLVALGEPSQVLQSLCQALDIRETDEAGQLELLQVSLAARQLLFVLDNFEHLLGAAPLLTELLEECPQLKFLVTSRAVLHLSYEHEFPLAPLLLPDLAALPDCEVLARCPAVALFVQRARMSRPDFRLLPENAATIAEICTRLDGLPLAIELAAARIRLFTPQMLLARLRQRLQLLIGRTQDKPARHQTLRANLDWSYHLLTAKEQHLFRLCAVFVGGCTFQAIEQLFVYADEEKVWVLDGITSLLEKSLLSSRQTNGEPRFFLLETVREYAWECLEQSGEIEAAQRAHADYYLRFMERSEPGLEGEEQPVWIERLERDYHNLRASLNWFLKQRELEKALHLAGMLAPFWMTVGALGEGRTFLEQVLSLGDAGSDRAWSRIYMELGHLLCIQGHFEQAEPYLQKSLSLARPLHFLKGMIVSLNWLGYIELGRGHYPQVQVFLQEALSLARQAGSADGIAFALDLLSAVLGDQGDYAQAASLAEESLRYYRQTGNQGKMADALWLLGLVAFYREDLDTSACFYEACLANYREVKDKVGVSWALSSLGFVAVVRGQCARARSLLEESLRLRRENGDQRCAFEYHALGRVAAGEGKYTEAYAHYKESLSYFQQIGYLTNLIYCLEGLAEVVRVLEQPFKAACILGCAEALLQSIQAIRPPVARKGYEELVATLNAQLGERAFHEARQQGQRMQPGMVLQFLAQNEEADLSVDERVTDASLKQFNQKIVAAPSVLEDLTRRELEIFRLLASGLTKSQIAERLTISFHTVNAHVRSIYSKVGVSSRGTATRYALEHGLV